MNENGNIIEEPLIPKSVLSAMISEEEVNEILKKKELEEEITYVSNPVLTPHEGRWTWQVTGILNKESSKSRGKHGKKTIIDAYTGDVVEERKILLEID